MCKKARQSVLGMKVDITNSNTVLAQVQTWSLDLIGRYICVSNVHMCMETFDNIDYLKVVNGADLIVPDGRPIVWAQHILGCKKAEQVRGADLTLSICEEAGKLGIPIGFYGATSELLEQLKSVLNKRYPELKIEYSFSPPFRALTKEEDIAHIEAINASGVKILFVGLGCPKQENWMSDHKDQLSCVMLGVGAAFDFIAGNKKHAPQWMQKIGLEWLFRLGTEPRRLWRRYLKHNPRFILYFFMQLLGRKYN